MRRFLCLNIIVAEHNSQALPSRLGHSFDFMASLTSNVQKNENVQYFVESSFIECVHCNGEVVQLRHDICLCEPTACNSTTDCAWWIINMFHNSNGIHVYSEIHYVIDSPRMVFPSAF